jgi:hypothetical protein
MAAILRALVAILALAWLTTATPASAITLAQLRADLKLTPERLMKYFAGFKFKLGDTVQMPDSFLASQSGDCDDFATLAADLLREKGYHTRLVVVHMTNDTHVVCYVAEAHAYLDFNRRRATEPLMPSDGKLADIAASVAKSFRSQWRTASEFSFRNGERQFLDTEFH